MSPAQFHRFVEGHGRIVRRRPAGAPRMIGSAGDG